LPSAVSSTSEPRAPLSGLDALGAAHVAGVVVTHEGVVSEYGEVERAFPLASVTKLLFAYSALVAVEEETIALDEPCGPPGATVAHLLAHASGLAFEGPAVPVAAPGTRRIYSSTGFEVLGSYLERASGLDSTTYLDEAVFAPLGMGASRLFGSVAKDAEASASDLARLCVELLAPTLISTSTLEMACAIAFPGLVGVLPGYGRQTPCDWGLGVELRDHKSPHWTGSTNSPQTFGHFGQSGTCLWVDPVSGVALVLLSDRPFGDAHIATWPGIADAVLSTFAGGLPVGSAPPRSQP
jgi:CubicO group peptidase (beta-lactamase class C family)